MQQAVERLYRRVQLMVGIGRTTAPADDSGRVQTVQVRLSPDEVRDGTRVVQQFGMSSHVPVGSDAVTLFLGGDRSQGLVIGTLDGASRPKGLAPGETVFFNAHGMSIRMTKDGIVIQPGGKPVSFAGDLQVQGNITATGEVTAHESGGSIALSSHHHPNTTSPVAGT